MSKEYTSLGLMSGTSGDGIDASIIRSDGISKYEVLFNKYYKYQDNIYETIHSIKEKINDISIISFYPEVIKEIKSIEPKLTANLLINFEGPKLIQEDEMVNVMHELNADGIGAQNHKSFDQNFYNTISKERKKVHVWTVNSKKEAKKYHELGVDSITTNCPGNIKEYLSKSF